jgi:hypothetical protein
MNSAGKERITTSNKKEIRNFIPPLFLLLSISSLLLYFALQYVPLPRKLQITGEPCEISIVQKWAGGAYRKSKILSEEQRQLFSQELKSLKIRPMKPWEDTEMQAGSSEMLIKIQYPSQQVLTIELMLNPKSIRIPGEYPGTAAYYMVKGNRCFSRANLSGLFEQE